ncbi:hypothetical protein AGMMS49940_02760 [Spirochaetia bacterium]|nr:hypothetical protein AGMMS49940_02760 [Spirochaetia bacterium]
MDIVVSRHSAFGRRKEAPVIERKIAQDGLCIYGKSLVSTRQLTSCDSVDE